jgi:hypothetical protein
MRGKLKLARVVANGNESEPSSLLTRSPGLGQMDGGLWSLEGLVVLVNCQGTWNEWTLPQPSTINHPVFATDSHNR